MSEPENKPPEEEPPINDKLLIYSILGMLAGTRLIVRLLNGLD